MKLISTSELTIKKSRFIGLLYSIDNVDDVDSILSSLKVEHKKARHIPYAYKIGPYAKKTDDKEPSGTAGTPIWNVIERKNLDNILIVVVRYFGGTKLGSGPLLRAYSKAASDLV
ncbi:MAG TPA: proline dipeptidase [Firmicutes bacterium]|nr:proline dipeptidase [Bacillota bacterium]